MKEAVLSTKQINPLDCDRPGYCPYCNAPRVNNSAFHWQYDCENSDECIKKYDNDIEDYLKRKYGKCQQTFGAGAYYPHGAVCTVAIGD